MPLRVDDAARGCRRSMSGHVDLSTRWRYSHGMSATLTRITVDPRVCSGQPCIRGLRIPVTHVLRLLAAGQSPRQITDEYPELESEDISECLRYAAWLASGRSLDIPPAA